MPLDKAFKNIRMGKLGGLCGPPLQASIDIRGYARVEHGFTGFAGGQRDQQLTGIQQGVVQIEGDAFDDSHEDLNIQIPLS